MLKKLGRTAAGLLGIYDPHEELKSSLKGFTKNLKIHPSAEIVKQYALFCGNDVSIEKRSRIDARGLVIIEDSSIISNGSVVSSTYSHPELENDNHYLSDAVIVPKESIIERSIKHKKVDDVSPVDFSISKIQSNGSLNELKDEEPTFILSTGRCGSKSIADSLKQDDEIAAFHEPFYNYYQKVSCELLMGYESNIGLKNKLINLYTSTKFLRKKNQFYVESDQKLIPFALILKEIFPKAKFVWLLRHPKPFLRSFFARGIFTNDRPYFIDDKIVIQQGQSSNGCKLHGDQLGSYSKKGWEEARQAERILWYWKDWNSRIESFFNDLNPQNRYFLQLESFNDEVAQLGNFITGKESTIKAKKSNQVREKDISRYNEINQNLDDVFEEYKHMVKEEMNRWHYED